VKINPLRIERINRVIDVLIKVSDLVQYKNRMDEGIGWAVIPTDSG
jgi:hypothetical protein